ncbi:hypothetical protein [Moorena sp. SIO3A5]|uniref:hypothetical protein n=1 Tax=Moorena sp. SIO3A5 TaxID=2607822 RepID=UPI00141CE833|nr:hypothetical protein [Moorena sp. SIO3A5]NEP69013.1 hypothetical protein [Moorena sp. SIO3A5]
MRSQPLMAFPGRENAHLESWLTQKDDNFLATKLTQALIEQGIEVTTSASSGNRRVLPKILGLKPLSF